MRTTKRQLRMLIREILLLKSGDLIDTFDKVESLSPGDIITKNGRQITVVDIDTFSTTLTYTVVGKSMLKDMDYRLAVRYDDDPEDMIPEIRLAYVDKGQIPQNTKQPPRATGPGRSYSIQD